MKLRTSFLSVLMLLFVAVLALLSPSCGSPMPGTEAVVTKRPVTDVAVTEVVVTKIVPTKEPAEQVHLVGQSSGDARDELERYLMDQCGVTYELIEADYWPSLEAGLAAGKRFDILHMDTTHLGAYAERGNLAPVDDDAGLGLDEFVEPLVQAFTFEKRLHAVPRESDALVLFYNVDLFAEAGLDEPNDDWTWGELKDYAWAIQDSTGVPGFCVPASAYYFYPFVLQAGGEVMSPDFSDTWIDRGEAIDGGAFYAYAREEGWAIIPEDVGASWNGEAFGWGEVAMVLGDYWTALYLSESFPDLPYGAVHAPAGPGGEGTLAWTSGYAVSANSSAPDAAWKAIVCLTSEEAQTLMLESRVALPSRRSFEAHPLLADDPVARAVYTSLEFASPYAWGAYHDEVWVNVREALRRVYYEGWSVEDSFAVAAEEIRAIIAP